MGWFFRRRPILFTNARVVGGGGVFASSLRIKGQVIDGFDVESSSKDVVVDLKGAYLFPGLINAHDHLEFNHYGRVKFRERYNNASEWVGDMNDQLASDQTLVKGRSILLKDRLFIGGIKNLLSGVTTVAHHNPFYRGLDRRFPVRIVKNYGWAHSFYLQGGKAGAGGEQAGDVLMRYRETPKDHPFIVHIAEGVDETAKNEFKRLKDIGCLGSNTILVHGVGLGVHDWVELASSGAGLIWCPSSNMFLLGETVPVREFLDVAATPRLALGSDSRLTGSRDLLEEMRMAAGIGGVTAREIFQMVSENPAYLFRLPVSGRLSIGFPADLLLIPYVHTDPFEALVACSRKDILLVTIDGQPHYGTSQFSDLFDMLNVKAAEIEVDGSKKLLAATWVNRLGDCSLSETGVSCIAN